MNGSDSGYSDSSFSFMSVSAYLLITVAIAGNLFAVIGGYAPKEVIVATLAAMTLVALVGILAGLLAGEGRRFADTEHVSQIGVPGAIVTSFFLIAPLSPTSWESVVMQVFG